MNDIEQKYIDAADLLEDVWLHINWADVDKGRMRNIWNEFEGQVRALSKCYNTLEPFLDKLCKRFDSFITKKNTAYLLAKDHNIFLHIFRYETQIPIMILRLRSDEKKELYKDREKNETLLFESKVKK